MQRSPVYDLPSSAGRKPIMLMIEEFARFPPK
jgi:hypothetical protein